jgi:hypothetical protein
MNTRTIRTILAALVLSIAAGLAAADGDAFGRTEAPALLEGSWQVRITPYVCGSDPIVSFPQAAVDSYLTFGAGGTLVETTSNPRFMPGQRSPGLGYWERTGRTTYTGVLQAFIQFATEPATPTSYVRGTQRVDQEIELVDDDNWTSTAVVTFRDVNGNKVPPSGCATAVSVRMP